MKLYLACMLMMFTAAISGQTIPQNESVKYLALGDSYTIGESVSQDQRWPVQLVKALNDKGYYCQPPDIIATTGWRTDDLMHAIKKAKPAKNYDLVSLLIGVNNQYQGKDIGSYSREFEELLKTAIEHAKGKEEQVFVLSIPDYGYTPFGKDRQPEISKAIDEFNAVNKKISQKYNVRYYNITDISRMGLDDQNLVASDGLHPSAAMYNLWVKRLVGSIED